MISLLLKQIILFYNKWSKLEISEAIACRQQWRIQDLSVYLEYLWCPKREKNNNF